MQEALEQWKQMAWARESGIGEQEFPAGALYIVGLPIGNAADITIRALWTLAIADCVAAEDTRQTQKILSRYGITTHEISVREFNEVTGAQRTENQVAPQQEEKIKGGDITVDIVSHTVTKGDKSIELTAKEFDLLVMLMRNSGRVLTRDTLLDRVWGVEYFGDTRTVDVHVRYLRQKIEDNPDTPQLLQTVRGVGYKFVGE